MKVFRAQELERQATSARLKKLSRRRVDEKELTAFVLEVAKMERELIDTKAALVAEREAAKQLAIKVLGQKAYDDAPVQAHPLELIEQWSAAL